MRYQFFSTSLLEFLVAILLLSLLGCDDHGDADAPPEGASSEKRGISTVKSKKSSAPVETGSEPVSTDQLRDKVQKQLQTMRENTEKAQADAAKKASKKKSDAKKKQSDDNSLKTFGSKTNTWLTEKEWQNIKSSKEPGASLGLPINNSSSTTSSSKIIAFNRSNQKSAESSIFKTTDNEEKKVVFPSQQPKKNWFNRIFGSKKEATATSALSDSATSKALDDAIITQSKKNPNTFTPTPSDHKDTLSRRLQAEMARRRLCSDAENESKPHTSTENDLAQTVELPPESAPQQSDKLSPAKKDENEPIAADALTNKKLPPSETNLKTDAEEQYRHGLQSRDAVAREQSFQMAAMERRVDAIPYLLDEIKENRLWAELAAHCLGIIGKLTPEVEEALLNGARSRDANMRMRCVESLGYLKCPRATQMIIEKMKSEKNYICRCVDAEALGLIGDHAALSTLKARLNDAGEIEFVKARAALALARLSDSSGRAHLIKLLDLPSPAMQVLGLQGLTQLNDPQIVGYLNAALESRYDEVWLTAARLFSRLSPSLALPVLRQRFGAALDGTQRRAALAMGLLGSDEGMPCVEKAMREGVMQERALSCEIIANLARNDRVPLLIERLQDSHSFVRKNAAVALTRLNATEALPALMEAARGQHQTQNLAPVLRGNAPDMYEMLLMLSCIRCLRGEKENLVIATLPNAHDLSWPEVDKALNLQYVELIKMYKLIDVISADNRAIGAVLRQPNGKEVSYREGELVAAGFKLREINLPMAGKEKAPMPAYIILMRGDERVILTVGQPPIVEKIKKAEGRR